MLLHKASKHINYQPQSTISWKKHTPTTPQHASQFPPNIQLLLSISFLKTVTFVLYGIWKSEGRFRCGAQCLLMLQVLPHYQPLLPSYLVLCVSAKMGGSQLHPGLHVQICQLVSQIPCVQFMAWFCLYPSLCGLSQQSLQFLKARGRGVVRHLPYHKKQISYPCKSMSVSKLGGVDCILTHLCFVVVSLSCSHVSLESKSKPDSLCQVDRKGSQHKGKRHKCINKSFKK